MMRPHRSNTYAGWAVETDKGALAGIYHFYAPEGANSCLRTAVFRTRAQAIAAMKARPWSGMRRVRRVKLTIETTDNTYAPQRCCLCRKDITKGPVAGLAGRSEAWCLECHRSYGFLIPPKMKSVKALKEWLRQWRERRTP